MTEQHGDHIDRVRRAVELCVLAPIGILVTLKDLAPNIITMFVARGRNEVDRRQSQIAGQLRNARGAGEVAIAFGIPMLKERITGRKVAPQPRATVVDDGAEAAPHAPAREPAAEPAAAPPVAFAAGVGAPTNGSSHLPIPGYDALSASQVVERLVGLSCPELESVGDYEQQHRNRRTILGKIDQLRAV